MSTTKASTKVKKYKLCRRLGAGVFEKCQTQKFLLVQGQGKKQNMRRTDYGNQMIEKQKVKFSYGVREKQFGNYVNRAMEHGGKQVSPATMLFQILESRLDNAVYRLGFANTRALARQMVSHGHILVNGKKTTVASMQLKKSDVISIREGSKSSVLFKDIATKLKGYKTPEWLNWNATALTGTVGGSPVNPDPFLQFQSVIEFYSR
ncbi:MAG: 30S ribosomal protein S4 [Candidatus Pacebacteria bacterium]|nr:30S ribosomal protein S4 [Candidatus Paceibacterota bacterium]